MCKWYSSVWRDSLDSDAYKNNSTSRLRLRMDTHELVYIWLQLLRIL